jgi:hypothetical protein
MGGGRRRSVATISEVTQTPDEFARICAGHATVADSSMATFALGMLAGAALHERVTFPQRFIDQAEACKTMRDVEALEEAMKEARGAA